MRKLLTIVAAMFITSSLFAGGLVTNTNQSAAWVRLPSRNASTSIDAVYYNPAGLMKLENGFHVSLSNQTIWQTREITNDYSGPSNVYGLNEHAFKGDVQAPLYPSLFAAYKMDKLAFSLGFGIVGGGGSATYKTGLPSFGMSASDLVPALASSFGANAYAMDAYLEGKSVFMGFQGAVSYKINDFISVAAGARYVSAKNSYKGHLQNIEVYLASPAAIGLPVGLNRADLIMSRIAAGYRSASLSTSQLMAGGLGAQTFATAKALGVITAAQQAQLEGLLTSAGYPTATPIASADQVYDGAFVKYRANSLLLKDQTADVEQKGTGITPFISVNISPSENLNIAVKYEMATKLDLKNNTTGDFLVGFENASTGLPDTTKMITMFPNGGMVRNDMPAMLTIGIDYKLTSSLKLSVGSNYWFDKSADYGHKVDADLNSATPSVHIANKDIIASNGMNFQLGLEYNISQKLLASGGYIWSNQGVNSTYQSDLTYGLGSQTFGGGGAYNITDKIQVNLGASYTIYTENSKSVDHMFPSTPAVNIPSTETYKKNAFIIGLGLDLRF